METNPKYFVVGISLIILILLTAGGFFWLTKLGKNRDKTIYVTYFRNSSLDGLQEGSIVTMRGIPVGSVKSLDFVSQDIERVRVFLSLKNSIPVKSDTKAVVQRNFLTGQAWIDLVKSTQAAPLLTDVPRNEEFPVIKEGQGDVEAIKNRIPEIINKTEDVMNRVEAILSPENQKHIEQTITNINSITGELTKDGQKPGEALMEFRKLAEQIRTTVDTIKVAVKDVKESFVPLMTYVSDSAGKITKNISHAGTSFSETMDSFHNPRSIITGPSESNLGPGESNQ